ncbi:unnamed protein product [Cuscuta epithymum]|uniref:Peptidase A1 domain-containing protein n=1 Tax=Cuscuta epithymum TaxID=186058 RepID=A0AAV0DKY6_9ASTE|nr:unnamed protein product [Cuscuta epithymum]CAH9121365.1 unnamed protein product [Cuscuta epithymum]
MMECTKLLAMLRFFMFSYLVLTPSYLCVFSSRIHKSPVLMKLEAKDVSHVSSKLNTNKPPEKLWFNHNVTLTATLSVGSPPQTVTMVLDTGSELSWLHCKSSPNAASPFSPSLSSSYSPVPCSSQTCTAQTRDFTIPASCDPNNLCHAILSYADSSSAEGNLATENFRVGDSDLSGVVFACMDSETSSNPDEDAKTTGLLGLNLGALSFVSQMGASKFSYCIPGPDSAGALLFGETQYPWLKPLSYTPLVRVSTRLPSFDRVAYTVQLAGIRVANTVLDIPESVLKPDHTGAGQTMVDSGTQFTFLLGPAYTALKDEFTKQTQGVLTPLNDPNFVFQGAMDSCFLIGSNGPSFDVLPYVTLMFDGAEMSVSGAKLLYQVPGMTRGSDEVFCLTFGNSDLLGTEAYVIGHHHQQNIWMEFDLANSRMGLAEIDCESVAQRLELLN